MTMGTNYYYEEKVCKTCKHAKKTSHIGKSSGGWTFSFYCEHGGTTWKEWQVLLQENGGRIVDEYGDEISFKDFKEVVEDRGDDLLNHAIEHPTNCYTDAEGYSFCTTEFC